MRGVVNILFRFARATIVFCVFGGFVLRITDSITRYAVYMPESSQEKR